MKIESWLLSLGDRGIKLQCPKLSLPAWLGMYHLYKPVDNDEDRIVACVRPIGRHKQSHSSHNWCKPANNEENQIITGAFSNL